MKTKKDIRVLGIAAAVLLLIAAFADLQISQFLYNPESIFGKIFEAIGEFPAMFIGAFCAMAIAIIQKKRNNGRVNLKSAGAFLLGALLCLSAGMLPTGYMGGAKALGAVLGIVIFAADYYMITNIARSHEKELYDAAVFGLQLFLMVILLFNLIKCGWGRERYRHMVQTGDFTGFTAWYLPQGWTVDNEFLSFPSGHSANAAISMWITMLPDFVPGLKTKEKLLKIISCVWIGCIMVSRVIMGAHFLGDVTMGMTLSLLLFYGLYRRKWRD